MHRQTTTNVLIELWCNGNTTDSGPVILGSNPGSSTTAAAERHKEAGYRKISKTKRVNKRCLHQIIHSFCFYVLRTGLFISSAPPVETARKRSVRRNAYACISLSLLFVFFVRHGCTRLCPVIAPPTETAHQEAKASRRNAASLLGRNFWGLDCWPIFAVSTQIILKCSVGRVQSCLRTML